MISVECSSCGRTLRVPESAAGKRGKCPGCGAGVSIPDPVATALGSFADPPPANSPPPLPAWSQPTETAAEPAEATASDDQRSPRRERANSHSSNGIGIWGVAVVALLSAILLVLVVPFFTSAPPPPAVKWEYRIISPSDAMLESTLETAGANGWEVVTARRATSSITDAVSYEMILKRLKKEQ